MVQVMGRCAAACWLVCVLWGGDVSNAAAATLRDGIYIIQMADSDMTVAATSGREYSPMILWPYRPTATWAFRHLGNDVYTVRTNSTYLDGEEGRGPMRIVAPHGGKSEKWKLRRVGRYYQFINLETGLAMTLGSGARRKGSHLRGGRPDAGSRDQLFCIQRPSEPRFCGEGRKKHRKPPRDTFLEPGDESKRFMDNRP